MEEFEAFPPAPTGHPPRLRGGDVATCFQCPATPPQLMPARDGEDVAVGTQNGGGTPCSASQSMPTRVAARWCIAARRAMRHRRPRRSAGRSPRPSGGRRRAGAGEDHADRRRRIDAAARPSWGVEIEDSAARRSGARDRRPVRIRCLDDAELDRISMKAARAADARFRRCRAGCGRTAAQHGGETSRKGWRRRMPAHALAQKRRRLMASVAGQQQIGPAASPFLHQRMGRRTRRNVVPVSRPARASARSSARRCLDRSGAGRRPASA